jgi:hypothetical protein
MLILLTAAPALASITAGNDRPLAALPNATSDVLPTLAAGAPAPVSANLQDILNYIYDCNNCVDATDDQELASMWKPSTVPGLLSPQLTIELSNSLTGIEFGMWAGNDPSSLILAPIFKPEAEGITTDFPASATLKWNTAGTTVKISGDSSEVINGTYEIASGGVGFYIKTDGSTWFSDDELNSGGAPQMLAYLGGNGGISAGAWSLAFEGDPFASADKDFNDFVVKIESLAAVPEPASIVLVGTVLLGIASVMRKRMVR